VKRRREFSGYRPEAGAEGHQPRRAMPWSQMAVRNIAVREDG
jgi:hypothetical protein